VAIGDTPRVCPDRSSVAERLSRAGCIAAGEEADELLRAADGDAKRLECLVDRRTRGEPVAWLTGTATFCGIELVVAPGVYVPRPQTEALARRAASLMPPAGIGVDLCTGAGAIAAVMSAAAPAGRVIATELDPAAARCARENGVEVLIGDLDEPLPPDLAGRVDVLIAVPPYVPQEELHLLPRDVRDHEPRLALDGGMGGTAVLDGIARLAPRWLRPGGWLLLELGGEQAGSIGPLLGGLGFGEIEVTRDEEGDPRGICARIAAPVRA
jgi:release factor glutamine methyltransferase